LRVARLRSPVHLFNCSNIVAGSLAVAGAFVIETDDLSLWAADPDTPYPNDYMHFGMAGTLKMGRRMAEKMHAKLSNAK